MVTRNFAWRGGRPIEPQNLQEVWHRAAQRVGSYSEGFDPHKLRTTFRSKLAELGISAIGEWQLGQGGDKYSYDLSGIDENFVIDGPIENGQRKGGLRRLWEMSPTIDRQTLSAQIAAMREQIRAEIQAETRKQIKIAAEDTARTMMGMARDYEARIERLERENAKLRAERK